jgi:hypothetical protein
LSIRRPGAQVVTNSAGQASPAVINVSNPASRSPSNEDNTVGVNIAALTCCSASNAVNACPAYTCAGATTNAAPTPVADNISEIDASKVGAATINIRDPALNP